MVTQQVGENPWHFCPSPQFVVTLEGSWYIRTSDGETTTFRPGDVLYQDNSAEHPLARRGVWWDAIDLTHTGPSPRRPNSERAGKHPAARSTGAEQMGDRATSSSSA